MTGPETLVGLEGLRAVAEEAYKALGIHKDTAVELSSAEEAEEHRRALYTSLGIEHEGLGEWCLENAKEDCFSGPLAALPAMLVNMTVIPSVAFAYECGFNVGLALGRALAEQAPEALS